MAKNQKDDQQENQFPEDQDGPGYDNDTPESWVTGANENATTKPGFDKTGNPKGKR